MTTHHAKSTDWNWESFRPEWANEGIERINAELEKWSDRLQVRSAKFRNHLKLDGRFVHATQTAATIDHAQTPS